MTVKGVPVRFMMRFAFSVRDFRIAGGPSWMNTDTYDIDAKASENVNLQQIRPNLQKAAGCGFPSSSFAAAKFTPLMLSSPAGNALPAPPVQRRLRPARAIAG